MDHRIWPIVLCIICSVGLTPNCYGYDPDTASPDGIVPPRVPENFKPVERADRLMEEPVTVAIRQGGKATLTFQFTQPLPAGVLHFGVESPGTPVIALYAQTERCKVVAADKDKLGKRQEAEINLRRRFASGPASNMTVCYRLEIYVPSLQRTIFYDGRFTCHEDDSQAFKVLTITYGPVVDCVTKTSAIVSLETDRPASAKVVVQAGTGKVVDFGTSEPTTRHEIMVSGLTPETSYSYQVLITADGVTTSSREFSFVTAPDKPATFAFAVMTDCRAAPGGTLHSYEGVNLQVMRELAMHTLTQNARMIFFPGDLVSGYTTSADQFARQLKAWAYAVEPAASLIPIYEGMGNHESCVDLYDDGTKYGLAFDKQGADSTEAIFGRVFVNPQNGPEPEGPGLPPYAGNVYYVDYGQVRVVTLNANYWLGGFPEKYGGNLEGYILPNQLKWLQKVLTEAENMAEISHVFVAVHEPVFPVDGHSGDAMWYDGGKPEQGHDRGYVIRRRDEIWQTVVDHPKVLAVICGDEHNYTRQLITPETPVYLDGKANPSFRRSVWHLITGGAGAPLYPAGNVDVPWQSSLRKVIMAHHYLLFKVSPEQVIVKCIGRNGAVLDECQLWEKQ